MHFTIGDREEDCVIMANSIDNQMQELIQVTDQPAIKNHAIETQKENKHKKAFQHKVVQYNAIACQSGSDNFDCNEAISESQDNLLALGAQSSLEEMLIAEMTSIHFLQQKTIALATKSCLIEHIQTYANSAIKLANCFTQQAALLAKLQGKGGQKIVVERVVVNQGGQALVANINNGRGTPIKKD